MALARKVWHLLVAIKDGLVLLFMLLFFVMLFGLLSGRPSAASMARVCRSRSSGWSSASSSIAAFKNPGEPGGQSRGSVS